MWRSRAVGCTCWRGDRPAWRKSGRLAVRLEPMIILELPPDKGNSPPPNFSSMALSPRDPKDGLEDGAVARSRQAQAQQQALRVLNHIGNGQAASLNTIIATINYTITSN